MSLRNWKHHAILEDRCPHGLCSKIISKSESEASTLRKGVTVVTSRKQSWTDNQIDFNVRFCLGGFRSHSSLGTKGHGMGLKLFSVHIETQSRRSNPKKNFDFLCKLAKNRVSEVWFLRFLPILAIFWDFENKWGNLQARDRKFLFRYVSGTYWAIL